jgi:hypothetical protein
MSRHEHDPPRDLGVFRATVVPSTLRGNEAAARTDRQDFPITGAVNDQPCLPSSPAVGGAGART